MPDTDAGGADFAEFVDASLPALLRFGYVLTGSAQEAEDLVQDALAKSLRRWRRVQADNPVAYTRRLRRGEDWDALRRALALLPSRQRAVLVLRYLEDLPDTTISVLLGCSVGTVRSHASRGLTALRPLLTAGTTGAIREGDTHVG